MTVTVEELLNKLDTFFREPGKIKEEGASPWIEATDQLWDELSTDPESMCKAIFRWGIILYKTKLVPEISPLLPKITSALKHEDGMVRMTAGSSIGWMIRANASFFDPQIVDQIVELMNDSEDNVRAGAVFAMQNILQGDPPLADKAVPAITHQLEFGGGRTRREIPDFLKVMGRLRPESVSHLVPKLEEIASTDFDEKMRLSCRKAAELIKKGMRKLEIKRLQYKEREKEFPPQEF